MGMTEDEVPRKTSCDWARLLWPPLISLAESLTATSLYNLDIAVEDREGLAAGLATEQQNRYSKVDQGHVARCLGATPTPASAQVVDTRRYMWRYARWQL
ncbi:hypothetical protein Ndes2437B_g03496 [Nannochloris sp. 'desiccata']